MVNMNEKALGQGEPSDWAGLSVIQRYQSSVGGLKLGTNSESSKPRNGVLRPFRLRLLITDAAILVVVVILGLFISSRASSWAIDPLVAVYSMPFIIALLWWGLLGLLGSYDLRYIGNGTEEVRRIVSATLFTFAVVAGVSYLLRADISRSYAFVSLPLGLLLIVLSRFYWRGWLYRRRAIDQFMHRTLLVGSGGTCGELQSRLAKNSHAGYHVVARYDAPQGNTSDLERWLDHLERVLDESDATAIAVSPSESLRGEAIRQLAWRLEGRSVDLLIAPAMMDIVGPRLSVRPAAGLPLLHLDEAVLSRSQRFTKRLLDLIGSILIILAVSPVAIVCAISIKFSSKGPVIFRQVRIGRGGQPFTMLKFRTMVRDAEGQKARLRHVEAIETPMFKIKDDPRITTVGKFLRRWSLDELPQLINVINGTMSLVGPRPHPLDDVNRYEVDAYRRLALKPGLTGLWQVGGRSNLRWSEALQLDLCYIESWSMSGDIVLMARTFRAVLQGNGAM